MAGVNPHWGSRTASTEQAIVIECMEEICICSYFYFGSLIEMTSISTFIGFKEEGSGPRGILSIDERHSSSCKPIKINAAYFLVDFKITAFLCEFNVYVSALLLFPKKSLLL